MLDTAFAGAENAPDAGGAGVPDVPNAGIGIPSVAGRAPLISTPSALFPPLPQSQPQEEESPNAAAILGLQQKLAAMQNPPAAAQPSKLAQVLKFLVPLIGATVSAGRGMGAEGWAHGIQQADDAQAAKQHAAAQQADQDAQAQERIAIALKDLQNQDHVRRAALVAQRKVDAQTADAAMRAKHTDLLGKFRSLADGGLIDTLNGMVDQGQDVNSYLDGSKFGGDGSGPAVTLREIVNAGAVKDPDGKHYLGGKTKTLKEVLAGSKQDVVEQALSKAMRDNGGKPISDDLKQKVTLAAVREYDQLPKDPTMQAIALAMKNTQEQILKLREQELENNMTPAARVAKRLGTEKTRIAEMDSGLQEAERLMTVLKVHGLDKDNNPIGPRIAALAARQGINPGDIPADIVQGAGYTKAKLFATLSKGGGRSLAQYKDMTAHLPESIQTGKQMFDVLTALNREYQGNRHNILRAAAVADEDYPFEHTKTNGKQYVGQKVQGGTVVGFDKSGNALVDDGK